MIRPLVKGIRRLLTWLIILAAVLLLLARLLLANLQPLRPELEQALGQLLQQPLRIGAVEGRWRGFGPEIELQNLQLLDPQGQTRMQLQWVRGSLDLARSLLAGQLIPHELTLRGLALGLHRNDQHELIVDGLQDLLPSVSGQQFSGLLAPPPRLRVMDSSLEFSDDLGHLRDLRIDGIDLLLDFTGSGLRLTAHARPSLGELVLQGEIEGDLARPGGWSGQLHARVARLDLAELATLWPRLRPRPLAGQADLELWSEWREGRVLRAVGRIDAEGANLAGDDGQLGLDNLGLDLAWTHRGSDWRLDLGRVTLRSQGRDWSGPAGAWLESHGSWPEVAMVLGLDPMRLEDALQLLALLPESSQLQRELAAIHPRGRLEQLRLFLRPGQASPDWQLEGRLRDLASEAEHGLPAVRGVNAGFRLRADRGELELDAQQSRVDFPALFRYPIELQRLAGRIGWQLKDGELWVRSDGIDADNADLESRTRVLLKLPLDQPHTAEIDLQTDFRNGRGERVPRYLPSGIMNQHAVEWLDRALVAGWVPGGTALLRGPLHDFPFETGHTGRFEVLFQVEDVSLAFHPEWPNAEQVSGEVRFVDNHLEVALDRGQLLNSQLTGQAQLASLDPLSEVELRLFGSGEAGDALTLLRETPLNRRYARAVKDLSLAGPVEWDLDLVIPTSEGQTERIFGEAQLGDVRLHLSKPELELTKLEGNLMFDAEGTYGDDLEAEFEGNPLRLSLGKSPVYAQHTRIRAAGRLGVGQILKRFPDLESLELSGDSDWDLVLDLPASSAQDDALYLEAESGLEGLSIGLPAPLGKLSHVVRPIELRAELRPKRPLLLALRNADLLDARFRIEVDDGSGDDSRPRLLAADLALGNAHLGEIRPHDGLRMDAWLNQLDLGPWLERAAGGGGLPALDRLNLRVGDLTWGDLRLKGMTLKVEQTDAGWDGSIESDRVAGHYRWSGQLQQPVEIDLEVLRFDLDLADNATGDDANEPVLAEVPPAPDRSSPRNLPGLRLELASLQVNNHDLGRFSLAIDRVTDGLELRHIEGGGEALQLDGRGSWLEQDAGQQHTELMLNLSTPSLGQLLANLDLVETLAQAPAELELDLVWPGGPMDLARDRITGLLSSRIGAGKVTRIDPGLGRLLGLVNIASLSRRLTLDFSDLFEEGLAFDRIRGDIQLEPGMARTDDLLIDGPAVRIEFDGDADLSRGELAQEVTVLGKLSSTLPIAGTLTGGPAVGAAMLLAQQLVGDEVDRMSAVRYRVSGPWEDPLIDRITPPREHETSSDSLFQSE